MAGPRFNALPTGSSLKTPIWDQEKELNFELDRPLLPSIMAVGKGWEDVDEEIETGKLFPTRKETHFDEVPVPHKGISTHTGSVHPSQQMLCLDTLSLIHIHT